MIEPHTRRWRCVAIRRWWSLVLLPALSACTPVGAQILSVIPRGSVTLPAATSDQFGQSFTIAGLSGITHTGAGCFVAVMDNSNKLVFIDVGFAADGAILSATVTGGLSLAESRDFEGVAYGGSQRNSVWLSDEGAPGVREFSLADGALLDALDTPPVFANRRANRGFESLTRRCDGLELWTANEEALTVDGPVSSPTNGTVVRLLKYTPAGASFASGAQYAYEVEPMHGGAISGGSSGLSELVQLPDGRLIALERSLAFNFSGLFQSRMYEVSFVGATDVRLLDGLSDAVYTPVTKSPLWQGNFNNMEGLALGPPLSGGGHALLGIVDDGDPLSVNTLVAFELQGVDDTRCPQPDDADGGAEATSLHRIARP